MDLTENKEVNSRQAKFFVKFNQIFFQIQKNGTGPQHRNWIHGFLSNYKMHPRDVQHRETETHGKMRSAGFNSKGTFL